MYRNSTTVIPYDDIDPELVTAIKLMNSIPGVETEECCVGHGKHPCFIWFKCESIRQANDLLWYVFRSRSWIMALDNGDPHRDWEDLHFCLRSDTSDLETIKKLLNWANQDLQDYLEEVYEI